MHILIESLEAAKKYLNNKGLSPDKVQHYNELKNLLAPHFGYMPIFLKFLVEDNVSYQDILAIYNILSKYRTTVSSKLSKQLQQYENYHELYDELLKIVQNIRISKILNMFPREQKDLVDNEIMDIFGRFRTEDFDKFETTMIPIISRYKTKRALYNTLKVFIGGEITYQKIIEKAQKNNASIISDKDNVLVLCIHDYKASLELGAVVWCISGGSSWDSYINHSNLNTQYFIYNFNLSFVDPLFLVGATIEQDGKIREVQNSNNERVKYKEYFAEYRLENILIPLPRPYIEYLLMSTNRLHITNYLFKNGIAHMYGFKVAGKQLDIMTYVVSNMGKGMNFIKNGLLDIYKLSSVELVDSISDNNISVYDTSKDNTINILKFAYCLYHIADIPVILLDGLTNKLDFSFTINDNKLFISCDKFANYHILHKMLYPGSYDTIYELSNIYFSMNVSEYEDNQNNENILSIANILTNKQNKKMLLYLFNTHNLVDVCNAIINKPNLASYFESSIDIVVYFLESLFNIALTQCRTNLFNALGRDIQIDDSYIHMECNKFIELLEYRKETDVKKIDIIEYINEILEDYEGLNDFYELDDAGVFSLVYYIDNDKKLKKETYKSFNIKLAEFIDVIIDENTELERIGIKALDIGLIYKLKGNYQHRIWLGGTSQKGSFYVIKTDDNNDLYINTEQILDEEKDEYYVVSYLFGKNNKLLSTNRLYNNDIINMYNRKKQNTLDLKYESKHIMLFEKFIRLK